MQVDIMNAIFSARTIKVTQNKILSENISRVQTYARILIATSLFIEVSIIRESLLVN
jgi:hypothetical protein